MDGIEIHDFDGKKGVAVIDGFLEILDYHKMDGKEYLFSGIHLRNFESGEFTDWISFDGYEIIPRSQKTPVICKKIENASLLEKLAQDVLKRFNQQTQAYKNN